LPLTKRSIEILRAAGWFPGRRVPVTAFAAALAGFGRPATERVLEFLAEFGGLRVDLSGYRDFVNFDAEDAVTCISHERLQGLEQLAQQPLTVVGFCNGWNSVMLMGPGGRLYAGADDLLDFGEPAGEALNALFAGNPVARLCEPAPTLPTGLTPRARAILERSGWTGTCVEPVAGELAALEQMGLQSNSVVSDFLGQFGGHRVQFLGRGGDSRCLIFSVCAMVGQCDLHSARGFEKVYRLTIVPVGFVEPAGWSVWLAHDGAMFLCTVPRGSKMVSTRDYELVGLDPLGGVSNILEDGPR
jgi:hypothetical protein